MATRYEILRRLTTDDNTQVVELKHLILVKFPSVSTMTRYSTILSNITYNSGKDVCSILEPDNFRILLRGSDTLEELRLDFSRQFNEYHPDARVHVATDSELSRFNEYFISPVLRQTVSVTLKQLQGIH